MTQVNPPRSLPRGTVNEFERIQIFGGWRGGSLTRERQAVSQGVEDVEPESANMNTASLRRPT